MEFLLRSALVSTALLVAACGNAPAEVEHARVAEERAREWLALHDAGDYGRCWETAAKSFQAALPKAGWEATAQRIRLASGDPMGRNLAAAKYTTRLPGAPPGEHVLVQYRVVYGGRAATETLIMQRDDEQWRTAGIRIRPE